MNLLKPICNLLVGLLLLDASVLADPALDLRIDPRAGMLACEVADGPGTGHWLLQHSSDLSAWTDLVFLEPADGERPRPGIDLQLAALPRPATGQGFFRARLLERDHPRLRELLNQQIKWRLDGPHDYRFEITRWNGWAYWRGIVTVANDEVVGRRTLETGPIPGIGDTVPTVDGLFALLAAELGREPFGFTVTWDKASGYPAVANVDPVQFIADEEYGWTIHSLTPTPTP